MPTFFFRALMCVWQLEEETERWETKPIARKIRTIETGLRTTTTTKPKTTEEETSTGWWWGWYYYGQTHTGIIIRIQRIRV